MPVILSLLLGYLSTIKGYVKDAETHNPLEYAVVVIYDTTGKQVKGTYTDERGLFIITGIKPGIYYLTADYMGYKKGKTKRFKIEVREFQVGVIYLKPEYIKMKEVVVEGRPEKVRREIDRLVVKPTGDIVNTGGSAKDVLKGVPGITVDINGDVKIKNSKNYTVLINGKPTMMDASEALEEIPASEIERIEVITNPSAEYDPESNAIVNIILKDKGAKYGRSINIRLGTFGNYGASLLWGVEKRKWSFYIHPSYFIYGQQLSYNMNVVTRNETLKVRDSKALNSDNPASVRVGFVYNLDKNTTLGMEGKIGQYIFQTKSEMYCTVSNNSGFYVPLDEKWTSNIHSVSLDFSRKFCKDNSLNAMLYLGRLKSNKDLDNPQIVNDSIIGGTRTIGNGDRKRMRFDMEYTGKMAGVKYKAGYRYEIKDATSTTKLEFYGDTTYQNRLNYVKAIHAGFLKFKSSYNKFGYSVGLRSEYMNRKVDTVHFKRLDLFPSVYVSYKIDDFRNISLSYSRRIERPDAYSLNPVKVWILPNEVHVGNPSLKPQYNHSFELNLETPLRNNLSFNFMLSYIYKHNYLNTIQEVDSEGNIIDREVNFSYRKDLGGNITIGWSPFKFINMNMSPGLWSYKFMKSDKTTVKDMRYEIPVNIQIMLPIGEIQIDGIYSGPYQEATTQYKSRLIAQFGFTTRIYNFTIIFGLLDALHTLKARSISSFSDGFREIEFRPDYPTVFLNLRYSKRKINKARTIEENYKEDVKGL